MRYILAIVFLLTSTIVSAHSNEEFLDLIDEIRPSIVVVVATHPLDTLPTILLPPGMGPTLPTTPEGSEPIEPQKPQSVGTGFVTSGGYIVTNWHVIEGAEELEVLFEDNPRSYTVSVIGSDELADIAVLKMEDKFPYKVTPLKWAKKGARAGQDAWVIGHPTGQFYSVTKGIVSHTDRRVGNSWQRTIQTDAAINHGNSGGPLLNMDGEIIGVNVALISKADAFTGVGLSIHSNLAKRLVLEIIKTGKVTRPLMGTLLGYDEDVYKVKIAGVSEGGAGELAGIEKGDLLIAVDGREIKSADDIFDIIALKHPGDIIEVTVARGDEILDFNLVLQELPELPRPLLDAETETPESDKPGPGVPK